MSKGEFFTEEFQLFTSLDAVLAELQGIQFTKEDYSYDAKEKIYIICQLAFDLYSSYKPI